MAGAVCAATTCREVRVPLGNDTGGSRLLAPKPVLDVPCKTFFTVLEDGSLARRVIIVGEDDSRYAVNTTECPHCIRLGAGVRLLFRRLLGQGAGPGGWSGQCCSASLMDADADRLQLERPGTFIAVCLPVLHTNLCMTRPLHPQPH